MSVQINGTNGLTFNDGSSQNTSPFVGGFCLRNRIINGDMRIDQRNAGASVTPADVAYTLDRWLARQTTAGKMSVQQNAGSVTPPAGFSNYLGVTSLSAYSIGASDIYGIQQRIEGYNIADLAWGTANAATVTLSFWVRSSLTGTFGGVVKNANADRSYPFSYTISTANTWELKSVTIVGETTGTWSSGNTSGILINFGLGVNSSSSGTAGSWASANYNSATGATSVVGTNGATFYITGVQLEKGSTATSFDYRPYGTELVLCQRYYEVQGFASSALSVSGINYGVATGNLGFLGSMSFAVVKRATPTVTVIGTWTVVNSALQPTVIGASTSGYTLQIINGNNSGSQQALTTSTSGTSSASEL